MAMCGTLRTLFLSKKRAVGNFSTWIDIDSYQPTPHNLHNRSQSICPPARQFHQVINVWRPRGLRFVPVANGTTCLPCPFHAIPILHGDEHPKESQLSKV